MESRENWVIKVRYEIIYPKYFRQCSQSETEKNDTSKEECIFEEAVNYRRRANGAAIPRTNRADQ